MHILGLIENLSGFVCPHCNHAIDLFSTGGGEQTAREMNVPFLGKIPIVPAMVQACDNGLPAVRNSDLLRKAYTPILEAITHTLQPGQKNTGPIEQKK